PDGGLVATTSAGFGATNQAIETQVASVNITNSTSGNIEISESDSLNVTALTNNATGNTSGTQGNITVFYAGTLTGQENASVATPLLSQISFNQRLITDASLLPVGNTGRTVGELSTERTVNAIQGVQGTLVPNPTLNTQPGGKTPSQNISLSGFDSRGFVVDLFAVDTNLFEVKDPTGLAFQDMGVQKMGSVWGPGNLNSLPAPKGGESKGDGKQAKRARKVGEVSQLPR
ncbi:MAG: hypothetical protein COV67_05640, partial [Nitrospinae bacterium CG11_big_fil_rev_8_21_14_0_20_56_8]